MVTKIITVTLIAALTTLTIMTLLVVAGGTSPADSMTVLCLRLTSLGIVCTALAAMMLATIQDQDRTKPVIVILVVTLLAAVIAIMSAVLLQKAL